MDARADLPRLVRELRDRTELTQEKFAAKLGVLGLIFLKYISDTFEGQQRSSKRTACREIPVTPQRRRHCLRNQEHEICQNGTACVVR